MARGLTQDATPRNQAAVVEAAVALAEEDPDPTTDAVDQRTPTEDLDQAASAEEEEAERAGARNPALASDPSTPPRNLALRARMALRVP